MDATVMSWYLAGWKKKRNKMYTSFAFYYDGLTRNVPYTRQAEYLLELLNRHGHLPGLTLDLACGTGSLAIELAKRGVDVYGADASMEMLSEAQQKAADANLQLLFLCQKMQSLDLFGTVDTVFCTLDSINHLVREKEVQEAFRRVSLFLNPGGYFVFDVNTEYKHKKILGNHTFVYDTEQVYCVWQNSLDEKSCKVTISLDFFEQDGDVYRRSSECFSERAYSTEKLVSWLEEAGMETVAVYGAMTFAPPEEQTDRIVFVTRKRQGG